MPAKASRKQAQLPETPAPAPQRRGFLSVFSTRTPAEVAIDGKLKDLDSKQRSIKELEDSVLKKKLDLNNYEAKLLKMRDEIGQQKLFVLSKEKELRNAVPKYSAEVDSLHKKKLMLESELASLGKKLDVLRPQVAAVEQTLAKAKGVEKRDLELTDLQRKLDTQKVDQDKRAGELSRKETELVQKDKTLRTQEFDALKKQKDITNDLIKLSGDKKMAEQELAARRSELAGIKAEMSVIEAKKRELKSAEDSLHVKEQAVVEQLGKLEKEKKFVEMRRGLVDKNAEKTHNLKIEVDAKEKNLVVREENVSQKEMALGRQMKSLQEQLMKIREVDELRENLPVLKKEKLALVTQISNEESGFKRQAEIIDKRARELNALERRVIDREKTANDREGRLKQREEIVAQKEKRVLDMRGQLEQEKRNVQELKFQTYVEKELGKFEPHEELLYTEIEAKSPKDFEVLTKVEAARNAMNKGNVPEARKYYEQISRDYEKMPMSDEKKRIYYEVLELKNDIELAMLK